MVLKTQATFKGDLEPVLCTYTGLMALGLTIFTYANFAKETIDVVKRSEAILAICSRRVSTSSGW